MMRPLRILFIEDERASIEAALDELRNGPQQIEDKTVDFVNSESSIRDFAPDIVVLDIFRGSPGNGERAGKLPALFVWNHHFCPLIIYSALPDEIDQQLKQDHPFIRKVTKGTGSEQEIAKVVKDLAKHVNALEEVRNEVNRRISHALKEVAPIAFEASSDDSTRKEFLVRASRRRIAADMDQALDSFDGQLASWEFYLFPAMGNHTRQGDVLIVSETDKQNAENYMVVLTPSCDLVSHDGREPKVAEALAARCKDSQYFATKIRLGQITSSKANRGKLTTFLSQGYGQSCVPLPALPGIFPPLVADLKDLTLIDVNSIGLDEGFKHRRVASIDSPFREMVSWAYLQVTGRPGLPDRDLDSWAAEIIDDLERIRTRGGKAPNEGS